MYQNIFYCCNPAVSHSTRRKPIPSINFMEGCSFLFLSNFINSSEDVFQCLDDLMKLNHSLLEPHLEQIWVMLWKGRDTAGAAYDSLVSSFISAYAKLRQVCFVCYCVKLRQLCFVCFYVKLH